MSIAKVVRYRTTGPEAAEQNQRLVENVFAELEESKPEGIRYAVFRLEDGITFLHVALVDGEPNPLQSVAAFGEFQREIADRVAEGPVATDATVVASYRLV
ncbi:MAG: hypothetical protein QOE01_2819 [Actinomycetota bacterium]|jgi:hypothetical protein|nr:hypothetical protein [Actinomycetota bacterium]